MKRLIRNFIKDMRSFTIVYIANTSFIIGFFYLDGNVSINYPIMLSVFTYLIYIVFKFFSYKSFHEGLMKTINNPNYDVNVFSNSQEVVYDVINTIHINYLKEIATINEENNNKNKMFSQWIHNMKTPVSVIELIVQRLTQLERFDDTLIKEIREENNKLLTNLDQLLSMIRVEDFSRDYIPENIDLYSSLNKIINNRRSQFIYNKVFPKLLCSEEKYYVLSDEKWNEFMIEQIISNAIKYSTECSKSKFIYFDIERIDIYTILTIRDEGIGIPEYDIDRVFDAFFTGENGRRYSNSTGIGLYICSVIAKKLGQDISIESEINRGTTVKIKYLSKM